MKMVEINEWIEAGHVLAGFVSFLIMVVLSFVPAFPIPLIAGMIAATFDFKTALLISWGGTVVGASLMFLLVRYFFQNWALGKIERWKKINGFFHFLQQNAFLAVLIARIIPILPSAGINLLAGMTRMSFWSFCLATALGKFPNMLAYTLAGHNIQNDSELVIVWVIIYSVLLYLIGLQLKKKWAVKGRNK